MSSSFDACPTLLIVGPSVECQLNTVGVRGALHESIEGKSIALSKYNAAVHRGEVAVVTPPFPDDVFQ